MGHFDRIGGRRPKIGSLNPQQFARYRRQLILDQIGVGGQLALTRSRVLVIGTGGLGAPALLYLVAAGVGQIVLVDFDTVDESNLHRQILFAEQDIGRAKTLASQERLGALNSDVEIVVIEERLSDDNARSIIRDCDVVVDGTDNFRARYAINDAAVAAGIPIVSASVMQFEAQLSVLDPAAGGPCYRCLYPNAPPPDLAPSCAEAGVVGVLPGIIGCLQANEVIKLICGFGRPMIGRLLTFEATETTFREFAIRRRMDCPCCAEVQPRLPRETHREVTEISCAELRELLGENRALTLLDVRDENERIYRIAASQGIPLSEIIDRLAEIPKDRAIICICQKGKRSHLAAQILMSAGFTEVYSVKGGMDEWGRRNA
ncbi:molybdopterin-synthase adenylyltransferase MoeB [Paracoccus aminophilus]|uniref:Molybdopterin-synthase adenylyltransferase n=1 Tax=Paracoccus aminophilus JCM 7686 TaxID=1367847 RepID=S5Z0E3_PARAH|nr:molybdopterin-synthase adenylyltransferase MoeB [Paracoccus aminophilus]AGT10936.1 molybdopterin biosynthesis protein MoeB [Paracoccus aminophilus JCM 7686]